MLIAGEHRAEPPEPASRVDRGRGPAVQEQQLASQPRSS
jgi:hypothetical protein